MLDSNDDLGSLDILDWLKIILLNILLMILILAINNFACWNLGRYDKSDVEVLPNNDYPADINIVKH